MSTKYLISGLAAAMVVAGGLAYAQNTEPTQQSTEAAQQQATPSTTDSQSQVPGSSDSATNGSSTSTSDAPVERDAQADRN